MLKILISGVSLPCHNNKGIPLTVCAAVFGALDKKWSYLNLLKLARSFLFAYSTYKRSHALFLFRLCMVDSTIGSYTSLALESLPTFSINLTMPPP